jgi:ATP-dependent DNA helicase RecG
MDQVGQPEPVRRALPTVVADALERIWDGATADDLESAVLDFKEDPAHTPTKNPDAKTTQTLVAAATCFANGSAGRGFIVFGIADRTPGPAAFNGTGLAPTDVEHRIFAHTRPHLSVDAWVETVHGARLIVIHVPAGLAVHTGIDGVVRHRVGDSCLPLAGPELDALTRLRANPDQTARASDVPVTQYDEEGPQRRRRCPAGRDPRPDGPAHRAQRAHRRRLPHRRRRDPLPPASGGASAGPACGTPGVRRDRR